MFQSICGIVLIAFIAINSIDCQSILLKHDYGSPLQCQSSAAAASPSVARKMCKDLIAASEQPSKPDIGKMEDLAAGCACGLSTHNIWYKGLTSHTIIQMMEVAEMASSELNQKLISAYRVAPKAILNSLLYDKLRYLAKAHEDIVNIFSFELWRKFEDVYYNIENGKDLKDSADFRATNNNHNKVAKNACYHLSHSELFAGLIKPSLEAIKSTMGKRADYAVMAGQPDLLRLMNFHQLCQAMIGEQEDTNENADY